MFYLVTFFANGSCFEKSEKKKREIN